MTDGETKMRYTDIQRRKECRTDKYAKILKKLKAKAGVTQLETELSEKNSKTVDFEKFKEYIKAKLIFNSNAQPFYTERSIVA